MIWRLDPQVLHHLFRLRVTGSGVAPRGCTIEFRMKETRASSLAGVYQSGGELWIGWSRWEVIKMRLDSGLICDGLMLESFILDLVSDPMRILLPQYCDVCERLRALSRRDVCLPALHSIVELHQVADPGRKSLDL